jgi:Ca2+-transporting ATPase
MEEAEPDTMNRPPRKSTDGIFSGGLGVDVIYQGVLVTVITIVAYLIGASMEFSQMNTGGTWFQHLTKVGESGHGMTMAFLAMSMCEIFHSFNLRSQRKSIFSLKTQNKVLWAAMLGSLLLTTLVIEVPFIANAFGFTPIGLQEYGISIGLAFLVIPVVELVKCIQRGIHK